jgi:hypothetical protein
LQLRRFLLELSKPVGPKSPFLPQDFGGNAGGPIGKLASFFAETRGDAIDTSLTLNGVTLDPSSLIANPFNAHLRRPTTIIAR